jgi:hypothetical protein
MDVYCLGVSAHFCAVETAADRLQQSGHLLRAPQECRAPPTPPQWLTLIVIPAICAVVKSVAMQSPHLVPSLQQT